MSDISTTLNACELVWRQQAISGASITEMRAELESHLREAELAGKSVENVVGPNLNLFALSWANAEPARGVPVSGPIHEARVEQAEGSKSRLVIALIAMGAVTVLGLLMPKGSAADLEQWQWIFLISAFALIAGELFTGSFYILPFGIGAGSAAILAFARVQPPYLIIVFIIVSALGLWGLREWAAKDDDEVFPVGANRYVGQHGVLTEPINGIGTVGRVKVETESWMAISDGPGMISAGSVVAITEVRGARLVVATV